MRVCVSEAERRSRVCGEGGEQSAHLVDVMLAEDDFCLHQLRCAQRRRAARRAHAGGAAADARLRRLVEGSDEVAKLLEAERTIAVGVGVCKVRERLGRHFEAERAQRCSHVLHREVAAAVAVKLVECGLQSLGPDVARGQLARRRAAARRGRGAGRVLRLAREVDRRRRARLRRSEGILAWDSLAVRRRGEPACSGRRPAGRGRNAAVRWAHAAARGGRSPVQASAAGRVLRRVSAVGAAAAAAVRERARAAAKHAAATAANVGGQGGR